MAQGEVGAKKQWIAPIATRAHKANKPPPPTRNEKQINAIDKWCSMQGNKDVCKYVDPRIVNSIPGATPPLTNPRGFKQYPYRIYAVSAQSLLLQCSFSTFPTVKLTKNSFNIQKHREKHNVAYISYLFSCFQLLRQQSDNSQIKHLF